jgi:hypothetical protein
MLRNGLDERVESEGSEVVESGHVNLVASALADTPSATEELINKL